MLTSTVPLELCRASARQLSTEPRLVAPRVALPVALPSTGGRSKGPYSSRRNPVDADLLASAAFSGPRSALAGGSAGIPVWTPEIIALFKKMNLPLPPDAMTGFPVKQDAPLKQLGRRLTDRMNVPESRNYYGYDYAYGDYGYGAARFYDDELFADGEALAEDASPGSDDELDYRHQNFDPPRQRHPRPSGIPVRRRLVRARAARRSRRRLVHA